MASTHPKKVILIVEYGDNYFSGWIETSKSKMVVNGHGETLEAMLSNIREMIKDYVEHEGKQDKFFVEVYENIDTIEFDIKYDLRAFLNEFKFINFAEIESKFGINKDLISQYRTGKKLASSNQVKKIETVIHEVANRLSRVELI